MSFKDEEFFVEIPGVPLFCARDLTEPVKDKSDPAFDWFVHHCNRLPKATGVIINTFEDLETDALEALREGKPLSARTMPSIYAVSPVTSESHETHKCLKWLDQQPPYYVVFDSFRSGGFLSREQITEVAHGLETSGHRFLWCCPESISLLPSPPSRIRTFQSFYPRLSLVEPKIGDLWFSTGLLKFRFFLTRPPKAFFLIAVGTPHWKAFLMDGVPMVSWPLFAELR